MRNVLLAFAFFLSGQGVIAQDRPNVVIILTDDQGSIDLNSYGADDLFTPHIDGLAKEGTRFTQFYAAAPLCSPSRASMLTGLNPHAAGLPGNASSSKGQPGMPTDRVTVAEVMKSAGYKTGHVGKWHLGFTPETMPNGQGFDYSYGHMGGCIDNYSHFFYWNGPNRHDLYENGEEIWADGAYFPDLMAQKADEFIERNKDEPFFLYYAINLPHYPVQPTAKWREHYKDLEEPRRGYAAFVSTIDERVGQLLSTLEKHGLDENTIVIFQSDHGHSVEQRNFGGGGNAGPFRGAKMSLFEGGIRVPAIIRYPAVVPSGVTRSQWAMNVDWFPTLLDFCGIETENAFEGKSLKPVLLSGEASPHQTFRWKQGVSWAIRDGQWKLIGYPKDPINTGSLDPEKDVLFLSDLSRDSSERVNLANQYPDKVEELLSKYMEWDYATEEDIPTKRELLVNRAKDAQVIVTPKPHSKYRANGGNSLVDEKLGSRRFDDGFWLGFEGQDMEAVIDLGEAQAIDEVLVGTLQDAESWIFFPESIEVSFSSDGKKYSKPIRESVVKLDDHGRKVVGRTSISQENTHARFVKVRVKSLGVGPDGHKSAGMKVWLFVDEITVR